MKNMNLRVINEINPNTGIVEYLPYGITTIEMRYEGDINEACGFVSTVKKSEGKNKFYVGYSDQSQDFLVIWGGGKEQGLEINRNNVRERLFLQVLHKGKSPIIETISLLHSNACK